MRKTNVVRLILDRATASVLPILGDRVSALWNAANYLCRHAFIKGEPVPSYSRLCALMKDTSDYRALPTHIGQEVLKKLAKSYVSFFRLRGLYNSGKLKHKPGMPMYRKNRKAGTRPWDFIPVKSTLAYAVKGNMIFLAAPKDLHQGRIELPFRGIIRYHGDFKTLDLKYDAVKQAWYAYLVVDVPDRAASTSMRPEKHAAGDIGARRTITVSTQGKSLSVVYRSRAAWKDYKYWTRQIAKEKSRLSTQGLKTSRRLQRYYQKRRLRLCHSMEALASGMVKTLRQQAVTHFTVGYPVNCRDNAKFGKTNELIHNFWSYELLLRIIEKHCVRYGIIFERVNERGTSSHCHICGRKVRRPQTDIVICPVHGVMHADVNASRNILKKKTLAIAGDGEQASLVWTVMRWDKHLWLSHIKSANERVLQAVA